MAKNFETPDFSRVAKETMRHIVHIAAVEGLRFFQDRFREQGWKNVALEPWKPKKHKDGYKILLKTRYLENSIQAFSMLNNLRGGLPVSIPFLFAGAGVCSIAV